MKQKRRPISPHLTVYKPQISSVLSILHRITGAFLFFSVIFLSWLLVLVIMQGSGIAPFEKTTEFLDATLDTMLFKLFLLSVAFCLYYHLLNGIRHLFWDAGYGFEIKSMKISGIFVVALSLFCTGATLALAIINRF